MREKLMLLLACFIFAVGTVTAQTSNVTGSVISEEDGQPVVGASVVVVGTQLGTVTDVNGKFNLSGLPKSAKNLQVSYIGMMTETVAIKSNVKVVLKSDSKALDEVMVVAYGTAKKYSFTGSASALKDKEMSAEKGSLVKSLEGKMAGVRVGAAMGDPGADQKILIRGIGSVNGSTQPLYVVDGVPVLSASDGYMSSNGVHSQSMLSTLNPNDIESMTVLKDAAASSLYGSRAANGVVVITTKKGKTGKTNIHYDMQIGSSQIAVKDAFKTMNAAQLKEYYTDALTNFLKLNYSEANLLKNYGTTDYVAAGKLEAADGWFHDYEGTTDTNWYDQVYHNALSQDHQLSMDGGTDKTKFFVSFGYNDTEGVVKGSEFERYSGRVNLDHEVNNWLKIGVKQMVSFTNSKGYRDQGDQSQGFGTSTPWSVLYSMDPTSPVYNKDGSYANAGFGKADNPNNLFRNDLNANSQFTQNEMLRSLSNASAEVKLPYNFVAREIFGYDYTNNKMLEFWAPESLDGESLSGLGQRWDYTNKTLTSSTTLNYANTFGKHSLSAMAGYEYESRKLNYFTASAKNYITYKLPELSNGQSYDTGSSAYGSKMSSWLGKADYNYNDTYYVSASFRSDGSSRLAKENRWASFWSVSAAWRLTKEAFMPDSPLFTDLKLRASYGTNGNLPKDFYEYMKTYATTGGYGENAAYYWNKLGNPDLGWEKSYNFNVGFDWNLYNRVNVTLEYYNKVTKDLLFESPISYVVGFGDQLKNIGQLDNKGIEFSVSSQNFRTKDFSWTTDFNLTWQSIKVAKLPDGEDVQYGDGNMYLLREGESMHTFYLPKWKGVNPDTGLGEFWADPNDESKGVVNKYSDAGNGIVGKAVPDVLGGMTNTFRYKDFDFSFMVSYQFGASLFDYPGYFLQYSDGVRVGNFNMNACVAGNYWKQPGDVVEYPMPIYGNPYRWDKFSSREIRSTDNIRVRDITLGYNVNVPALKQYISSLRVYVRTTNPFFIYNATKDVDPDVDVNGYRQTDTPATRQYLFGLNLTF